MIIYSIPYFDEDECVHINDVVLEKEEPLDNVLRIFLSKIEHGYLDDDYSELSLIQLLQICVEQYKIHSFKILQLSQNQKPKLGRFYLEEHFIEMAHFEKCLDYIKNHDEIILSTQVKYEGEVESDYIQLLYNGIETFLFIFYTLDEEYGVWNSNSELYDEYVIPFYKPKDEIQIDKPLTSENQIIDVFKNWAKNIHLDITDKNIRLAEKSDYIKNPFLEDLKDTIDQDPDHKFSTPGNLMFFNKDDIPPFDELVASLKKETPETIACVIDDFKNDTILKILEALGEPLSQQVMEVLPLIPCQTFKEKKRFINLLPYTKEFAENRILSLQKKYNRDIESIAKKEHKKYSEEDNIAEYLVWKDFLSNH